MNSPAPIVLFVYNRPEHTLKTLNSLKNNKLSTESKLFIFADGPKKGISDTELLKIEDVRKVIRQEKWCKEVEIIESVENKGLSRSIIDGVTQIVNEFGKIIVLEDDLSLSPGFLQYMNDALNLYENTIEVYHIAGFTYPVRQLPETFFLQVPTCWGWATWARAWQAFNPSAHELMIKVKNKGIKRFDFNYSINYRRMLQRNLEGRVNSWFIRWYASIYLLDGLCLHPGKTLVSNIGLDHSGVNSYKSKVFEQGVAESINVTPVKTEISETAVKYYTRFNWLIKIRHIPEYAWRVITRNTNT